MDTRLYQAYLLRLWRDTTQSEWRASLQNTKTNQLFYFASLEALFKFIEVKTVDLDVEVSSVTS